MDETPDYKPIPEDEGINTGKPKKLAGRPRAKIDAVQVGKLAEMGCTTEEIGEWFNVDGSTIRRNFGHVVRQAKAKTKVKLRNAQLETALKGDKTMLVWLGKQLLSQSDDGQRGGDDVRILPWTDDDEVKTEQTETEVDITSDEQET